MKFLILTGKGFVLGLSMILPGISGGTMAFVLGIYEKLIQQMAHFKMSYLKNVLLCLSLNRKSMKSNFLILKRAWDWKFLTPLIFGIFLALVLFISLASGWIQENSLIFYSLIFGLILASMISPLQQIKKSFLTLLLFFMSFIFNLFLFIFGKDFFSISGELTPLLFLPVGFLISTALIVPGISGSYLLLLLGLYEKTLLALKQLDVLIICFFSLGVFLGFILTAKLIQKMLKNYFNQSLAVILGLIFSSLYAIYPLDSVWSFNREQRIFWLYMLIGFFLFAGIQLLSKIKKFFT